MTERILSEEERRKILFEWNSTYTDFPLHLCLHQLFESQAVRTGEQVAVVFRDQALTYAELNQRANQLAHFLKRAGVGPEVLVGVCMERSLEMVISLYGILKAGGAYVPLDPDYPAERLEFMLKDTEVPVVLTQASLSGRLGSFRKRIVHLDTQWQEIAKESAENPLSGVNPENLAYVIYTSGSTGKPKGVMNCHKGICNRLLWMQQEFQLNKSDRVLQKTPFSFDVSVWEFFWPLITGARLILAEPGGHKDSSYLVGLIKDNGITILHFVPSMLRVFLTDRGARTCDTIKKVISSGELLSHELQELFFDAMNAELHNLYGPTEAAVDVTHWTCQRKGPEKIVPIGRPISNTRIYILDDEMRPVPVGDIGELCIGGVQVARGYLNRPELTAGRFVCDPFSSAPDARLYKTGDLARFLPDGNIVFLGRADDQIKIRGFRVELGEIEVTLASHPAVEQAAVIVRDRAPGDRRLEAYIIPDQERAFIIRKILRLQSHPESKMEKPYELPNGLVIDQLNPNETEFSYKEIFEDRSYLKDGICLGEGAVVFDVGANIGLFSLFVATAVPDAVIYAFEPVPSVFKVLKRNASLYNFNITPMKVGLSNEPKSVIFTYYPHVTILSSRYPNPIQDKELIKSYVIHQQLIDQKHSEISARVVDDLLAERLKSEQFRCEMTTVSAVLRKFKLEHIDLLKIDVEKSEHEVLGGILEEDWIKIRQIVVEVHDIDSRVNKLVQMLEERDYEVGVEQDPLFKDQGLYILYARRRLPGQCHSAKKNNAASSGAEPSWTIPAKLIEDLRGHLGNKLPEYMMPAAFVLLDELPLTASGKLDRRALSAPDGIGKRLRRPYFSPQTELERRLTEMWSEILTIDRVGIRERFFELGGDSIKAALFINKLQKELNEFIYIVTIFEYPTIADYAAFLQRDYSEAVARWLGFEDRSSELKPIGYKSNIDYQALAAMRNFIPSLSPSEMGTEAAVEKNPKAIFVLAPPRSGTTLLRVMLAGHPRLFAAPELQLLCFNTLRERKETFVGKLSAWLEGTIRAIMEIKSCSADEAKRIMRSYEDRNFTTKDFYCLLQEWIGERILVEKTPTYSLDLQTLLKAERDFDNPQYIHLVRHPYATVLSISKMHMDQVLYLHKHPFNRIELSEMVWTISHQNILEFLQKIPESRKFRMTFEDLVLKTREVMEAMCCQLGLEFHQELLLPYKDTEKKMTDGIYPESTPMGDVNFLQYKGINPEVAETWKEVAKDNFLSDITWDVAETLGYKKPDAAAAISSLRRAVIQRQRTLRQAYRESGKAVKSRED